MLYSVNLKPKIVSNRSKLQASNWRRSLTTVRRLWHLSFLEMAVDFHLWLVTDFFSSRLPVVGHWYELFSRRLCQTPSLISNLNLSELWRSVCATYFAHNRIHCTRMRQCCAISLVAVWRSPREEVEKIAKRVASLENYGKGTRIEGRSSQSRPHQTFFLRQFFFCRP